MLILSKGQEVSRLKKYLELGDNTLDCEGQDLGMEVTPKCTPTGGLLFQRPLHDT